MAGEFTIRKATAKGSKALVAVRGPAGSGKTLGALILAQELAGGGRVVVIDTETKPDLDNPEENRGRSESYAGSVQTEFASYTLDFDVMPMTAPFSSERYIQAMRAAVAAGARAIVIDSASHEWSGEGGVTSKAGADFASWKKPKQDHSRFEEELLRCPVHVVVTIQTKVAFEQVDDPQKPGKKKVVKLGLQPIQSDRFDYRADVMFDVGDDHVAAIWKANANYAAQLVELMTIERRITPKLGKALRAWVEGTPKQAHKEPSSGAVSVRASSSTPKAAAPAPTNGSSEEAKKPASPPISNGARGGSEGAEAPRAPRAGSNDRGGARPPATADVKPGEVSTPAGAPSSARDAIAALELIYGVPIMEVHGPWTTIVEGKGAVVAENELKAGFYKVCLDRLGGNVADMAAALDRAGIAKQRGAVATHAELRRLAVEVAARIQARDAKPEKAAIGDELGAAFDALPAMEL